MMTKSARGGRPGRRMPWRLSPKQTQMSLDPTSTQMHNCRRVLRMISELHVRGYQRLRMVPHLYALGTWRCGITWAANTRPDHGAIACDGTFEATPQYTSASGREVFAWADATHLTPSRL